eukprot:CAMPEP_0119052650 /NCGR_PEP_ID=MMETSP1177-20130426/73877_1 /TAXON_ID=2985 /ORGANISM="Ochromonas sp, Strain CCMP1899" /LENGTH=678 /DNA_ID=CAMNT_0007032289 /DNA_START=91 /DNA_END=2123 /DNA_ORIENTATION=-
MSNDLEDGKYENENVEIEIEEQELQNNTEEIEQQEVSNLKDKNEAETSLASGNFLSNGSNDTMDTAEGLIGSQLNVDEMLISRIINSDSISRSKSDIAIMEDILASSKSDGFVHREASINNILTVKEQKDLLTNHSSTDKEIIDVPNVISHDGIVDEVLVAQDILVPTILKKEEMEVKEIQEKEPIIINEELVVDIPTDNLVMMEVLESQGEGTVDETRIDKEVSNIDINAMEKGVGNDEVVGDIHVENIDPTNDSTIECKDRGIAEVIIKDSPVDISTNVHEMSNESKPNGIIGSHSPSSTAVEDQDADGGVETEAAQIITNDNSQLIIDPTVTHKTSVTVSEVDPPHYIDGNIITEEFSVDFIAKTLAFKFVKTILDDGLHAIQKVTENDDKSIKNTPLYIDIIPPPTDTSDIIDNEAQLPVTTKLYEGKNHDIDKIVKSFSQEYEKPYNDDKKTGMVMTDSSGQRKKSLTHPSLHHHRFESFSVPQAKWDPELVCHLDIAPKVHLEGVNEDDVEKNDEEAMIVNDKQGEKDGASLEEANSIVTDDNDKSVLNQNGPDAGGSNDDENRFILSPRAASFKSFSVPEGQWDIKLPSQSSRSLLEATHEDDSGQSSDNENDPVESVPVMEKAEDIRKKSILILEGSDDSEKDKIKYTPNRRGSFKSFSVPEGQWDMELP